MARFQKYDVIINDLMPTMSAYVLEVLDETKEYKLLLLNASIPRLNNTEATVSQVSRDIGHHALGDTPRLVVVDDFEQILERDSEALRKRPLEDIQEHICIRAMNELDNRMKRAGLNPRDYKYEVKKSRYFNIDNTIRNTTELVAVKKEQ